MKRKNTVPLLPVEIGMGITNKDNIICMETYQWQFKYVIPRLLNNGYGSKFHFFNTEILRIDSNIYIYIYIYRVTHFM